ncbi:MAG TPA: hypothetical protein VFW39_08375 [Sphingomicrobium sp.]|nr:hypothetical protein [Sphingomicrobium sp.]
MKTLIDTGAALPFGVFLTPDVAREAAVRWNLARGTIAKGSIGGPLDVYGADIGLFVLGPLETATAAVTRGLKAAAPDGRFDAAVGYAFLHGTAFAIDYQR